MARMDDPAGPHQTPTAHSERLERLARRVVETFPSAAVNEVVLTGSVSRGVADEFSDIEMLLVTREQLDLEACFAIARAAGLDHLDSWGSPDEVVRRVSGRRDGVPLELIWWPRSQSQRQIDRVLAGELPSTADALLNGVPLKTVGLLADWQQKLSVVPEELAKRLIEAAALPWGGFHAEGLLTLTRATDRLALAEWIVDGVRRVLTIVHCINRVWQPTSKRLADRVEPLELKPPRLVARINGSLTEDDPRRALLQITELQLDAVVLAPSGPNIDRARIWLAEGSELLRR